MIPWCKRLDWLNYRDKEVAKRLDRYTLVKLNVDLDRERTAARLGLKGVWTRPRSGHDRGCKEPPASCQ